MPADSIHRAQTSTEVEGGGAECVWERFLEGLEERLDGEGARLALAERGADGLALDLPRVHRLHHLVERADGVGDGVLLRRERAAAVAGARRVRLREADKEALEEAALQHAVQLFRVAQHVVGDATEESHYIVRAVGDGFGLQQHTDDASAEVRDRLRVLTQPQGLVDDLQKHRQRLGISDGRADEVVDRPRRVAVMHQEDGEGRAVAAAEQQEIVQEGQMLSVVDDVRFVRPDDDIVPEQALTNP
mmetsp:Transcript_3482/g.6537  ORF Transcript_3482/g.6537 Transcript_3482/m.6537 type:complete len:246 (+) Transcript_3482:241-978(+)